MGKKLRPKYKLYVTPDELKLIYTFDIRNILSDYGWAKFLLMVGGRGTGKSFQCQAYAIYRAMAYGEPFLWIRLTDVQVKKLLNSNAGEAFEPELLEWYGLNIRVYDDEVFHVIEDEKEVHKRDGTIEIKKKVIEKIHICTIKSLSTYHNTKGTVIKDHQAAERNKESFIKDQQKQLLSKGFKIVYFDEFNREKTERHTFDIKNAFFNVIETVKRMDSDVRMFFCGNDLSKMSDVLAIFNFIPYKFGVFPLKRMKAICQCLDFSEEFKQARKESLVGLLGANGSTFTNMVDRTSPTVIKGKLGIPIRMYYFGE